MTAIRTPRAGGVNRRSLIVTIIVLLVIAVPLLIWSGLKVKASNDKPKESKVHAIVCDDGGMAKNGYQRVIIFQTAEIAAANKVIEKGSTKQAQKAIERRDVAQVRLDEANVVKFTCLSGGTPATTATPTDGDPDGCGVKYRSYDVKPGAAPGTVVRFGNQPVDITGPGDAKKVLAVLDRELSTDAFKAAVMTQGNYLVDGGISVDQVQATATRFQQNRDQWSDSNRVVRSILRRAQSVTLEQTDMPYNTQDAVLGANRCVAPAAQNAQSSGKKWILVIHLSQQDAGRTVRLVVNCDFQIQEFGQTAKPAKPVRPSRPGSPPPTTAPPPVTTAPPATTAPPTAAPPTTAPTTAPPSGKPPQENPCIDKPKMPGC